MTSPKRPRDLNQLAKTLVGIATGEISGEPSPKVARSQKAGTVGGPARAKKLTAKQRSEIARTAAQARWKKN